MPVHIALLRGVNVGGVVLKMESLRAWCAGLGWRNVRTYVQSGNVIFESRASLATCVRALEEKLAAGMGRPVAVVGRAPAAFERIAAANPFLGEGAIDTDRLYVTFLASPPAPAALESLAAITAAGTDRLVASGQEIYLHCPGGYGETKLSNTVLEKKLAVKATTRNWNTVNKLLAMARE